MGGVSGTQYGSHIHDACLTPRAGDIKYVERIEYSFDGNNWRATGKEVAGLTNTPRAGELEGSRDRTRQDGRPTGFEKPLEELRNIAGRLETDSAKRKAVPLYSGVMRYFPDALADLAALAKAGNDKHNPGEPLHWSRGKSDDHLDSLARHLLEAGTMDTDGYYHDLKILWRAAANYQTLIERERGLPISPGSKA